jgi:hypothetical protein
MYRGYIKVWRKIADAGWLKNHKLCAFWLWCLMQATHKEMNQIVGCQNIHLMPGDFIFGLYVASEELEMSIQSTRTILKFLKNSKNITIKSTNKFSIISIVNWNTYQIKEDEINNQSNKPLTNQQQTTNNKQECKEHKNEKKIFIIPSLSEISDYCHQRHNNVKPEVWLAHYESNGWMVGKNKMKDWRAAIRTWENSNFNNTDTGEGNIAKWLKQKQEEEAAKNANE